MAHTVSVVNTDTTLGVSDGTTILQAAQAAGLAYPHGCQIGRCGSCKSRLISGEVDLLPHTPFALTAADKERGLILACRAVPRKNCAVAWLGNDTAAHPLRDEVGSVTTLVRARPDITIVDVALYGAPLGFSAGQYAELTFTGRPPRNYSMASRSGANKLVFHIRHVPGGATSGFVADGLKVGDRVRLRGPIGNAHLRARHTGPIVAVAGGSGLAPILSILGTACALRLKQPVKLYFAARSTADLYQQEQIAVLCTAHDDMTYVPVIGRSGELVHRLRADLTNLAGWKAYVAGSPRLVDEVTAALVARGLAIDDCHGDAFFTAVEQSADLAAT